MTHHEVITQWLTIALNNGYIHPDDTYYVTNTLLHLIGEQTFFETATLKPVFDGDECMATQLDDKQLSTFEQLTQQLIEHAVKNAVIPNETYAKQAHEAKLLDVITPRPSIVNERFYQLKKESAEHATDYFYRLCCANRYVKANAIAQNIELPLTCEFGELEITINLAKPEKDPKVIAAQKDKPSVSYPETLLAMSNEGFYGNVYAPERSQHRIIRLTLNDELFGFQYSPYGYFNEHSILFSQHIRPMAIDQTCFEQLIEAVDFLPHYIIGSNADLPIVGGSILSHHHFQAGKHIFPMLKAKSVQQIPLPVEHVDCQLLHWPLTVLKLQSKHAKQIIRATMHILNKWQMYSDERVGILAQTNTTHQTITPIVQKDGEYYCFYLVLRNNRTTDELPYGLFHPSEEKHHIKKENIGLIEVMGRAILPARLKDEMQVVAQFVNDALPLEKVALIHQKWATTIKKQYVRNAQQTALQFVYEQMGHVFVDVLKDCNVFKYDESHTNEALQQFLTFLQQ